MMDKINLEVSYNANEWTQIESDFIFIFGIYHVIYFPICVIRWMISDYEKSQDHN
jgi:hypothetical protein